jgi:outer membrane protein assembly factor BamB
MTWRSLPRGVRLAVIGAISAVLLAASGIVLWRVLGPAEVVTPATQRYPDRVIPAPGAIGALMSAPLMLDSRLRVYATQRQVWTDAPPDFKYERSALWSFRRWPAQVVGVLALNGSAPGSVPVVVSAWSDGVLVGVDARTGTVGWQVQGEALGDAYVGRRTGADTVYRPPGLFTGIDSDGRTVVVTAGPKTIRGYDPSTGAKRWEVSRSSSADCRGVDFTAPGQYVALDSCAGVLHRIDLRTGATLPDLGSTGSTATAAEPVSCVIWHSQCPAVRLTSGGKVQAWVLEPSPASPALASAALASPALAEPGSILLHGLTITPDNPAAVTKLTARDLRTGEPRWTWEAPWGSPAPALIGTGTDRIMLLMSDRTMIAVSAESGNELSRASVILSYEPPLPYEVNQVYISGQYVVLERINPGATPDMPDTEYYFTHRPVLIAGS